MSNFSVRKPFTILVGVIIVIILGVMSFTNMTTDLLPSMNFPYLIVTTTYIGATPEKVENTISIPLEQALSTTSNVKTITSTSSENYSMVMLEFEENTNIDSALIELNSKIDLVETTWKDEMISSPIITKINPDMLPVMIAGVNYNELQGVELTTFLKEYIIPELEKVSGVASIDVTGLIEENIQIKLNEEKIDLVNKKILENIDKELAKSEGELKTAQSKLTQGKQTLEKQSAEKNFQINEGLAQINTGILEINKANAQLLEQEKQLKNIKTVLEKAINFMYEGELAKAVNTVKTEVSDFFNDFRDVLSNINLNENINILNKEQLEDTTVKNNINLDNNTKNEINVSDKESSEDNSIEDRETLKEILYNKLNEVNEGLIQIEKGKSEINNQLTTLNNKKTELETGKLTLNIELNNAKTLLNAQEEQLKQGLSEFESAREEAYKNASLDGVLTGEMISNILMADNFSMPAGYIEQSESNDMIVKVGNEFSSLDEIKNLTILSFDIEGLENVTLEQLADIEIKNNSDEIYAKINGNDAVMLSLQKQSTVSTGEVVDNIKEKIIKLQDEHKGLNFIYLMDQGIYIDMVIGSVLENLLYGAILAVIVLFLFLRDVKPTIAVALSIPVSLMFAIALMYFTGVSINIISLSGLALSVGMLVDNAIVVIENIYRLRNKGMSLKEASIQGAKSVSGAIFASTLTTICVFIPIIFIEGVTRQLFQDMALTIAYSLMASLIVALTVIPSMTSKLFTKENQKEQKFFNRIIYFYERILEKALKYKKTVLFSSFVLLCISVLLIPTMGLAFIPDMEGTQASITLEFSKDITESEQKTVSNEILNKLLEIEDISEIGVLKNDSGMSSATTSNTFSMYLILNENRKLSNIELEEQIQEKVYNYENLETTISTSNMDMSALGGSGIQIKVKGDDLDKLQSVVKELEILFSDNEGIQKIETGIEDASLEKRIVVNKNKAMEYGLTVAQIYSLISEKLTTELESTILNVENKEYPIIITKTDSEVLTKDTLQYFEIEGTKNNENVMIKISDIATIEEAETLNSINREYSTRYITMTVLPNADTNIAFISNDIEKEVNEYIKTDLPEGIEIEISGENETIINALKDLFIMIALAVVLIYLIMVAQFQSIKLPFIIMFTIPLAFTGGLISLFITGHELSVISMIGFLVLSGIVVNNGIVFVDYVNQLIASGKNKKEALLEAGRTRLRPIVMTALTTILGMLTMAFGIGMGADMIQPLGLVTIGGLIYSTLLTLLVVPCMYDIMMKNDRIKNI